MNRPADADGPTGTHAEPVDAGPDAGEPGSGPSDEELDAEEARLALEILEAAGIGTDQSAEEAVAEAVELARRFESERDEYLDLVRRVQAEFENYKRRVDTQREEQRAQAAVDLVGELLPVLDACDAAVGQGLTDVEPIRTQLVQTLERRGLGTVDTAGVPFDPRIHEAVLHEEGDGSGDAEVVEVMRTGYLWNDRVVRAAMVKVRS